MRKSNSKGLSRLRVDLTTVVKFFGFLQHSFGWFSSLDALEALRQSYALEEHSHRFGRLSAIFQPVIHPLLIHPEGKGLGAGIVVAQNLQDFPYQPQRCDNWVDLLNQRDVNEFEPSANFSPEIYLNLKYILP